MATGMASFEVHGRFRSGAGKRIPPEIRFWAYVDKNGPIPQSRPDLGPCWVWRGNVTDGGYGKFSTGGSTNSCGAHQFSYELAKGKVPAGLEVDHLCRNRACVNPKHLEAVTPRVNVLRGDTVVAKNAAKTHCIHGHPFSGKNLYVKPSGERVCKICRRAQKKLRREKLNGGRSAASAD